MASLKAVNLEVRKDYAENLDDEDKVENNDPDEKICQVQSTNLGYEILFQNFRMQIYTDSGRRLQSRGRVRLRLMTPTIISKGNPEHSLHYPRWRNWKGLSMKTIVPIC